MPYEKNLLPSYPCTRDMWDELRAESRPVVIYGMGNGADKLIEKFELLGIRYSDIFASDGFVRGHSFRGVRVKSFAEIRETYSDFVIVLSFGSNRGEVIDMLSEIDAQYDMYVPDMPVAGVEEFFDREFYNSNYNEIVRAYESLADEDSKRAYASIINFKLFGRLKYLEGAYSDVAEMYSLMPAADVRTVIDAGAYNGDTAREMKSYFPNLKTVYALEPDKRNFKKLAKYSEAECEISVVAINSAAWSEDECGVFFQSGNRNSTISATVSYENEEARVSLLKIDSVTNEKTDYIKYDVEGAEREALAGSHAVISSYRPTLLVSLYHRSRDLFELVNMLAEKYLGYKLYIRRLRCLPAWEINLVMVPEDSEKGKKK